MEQTEQHFTSFIANAESQQELLSLVTDEMLRLAVLHGFRKECIIIQIPDPCPTPFMMLWDHAATCAARLGIVLHAIHHLRDPRLPFDCLPTDEARRATVLDICRHLYADYQDSISRLETTAADGFYHLVDHILEFARMASATPATEHNMNIFSLSSSGFEQIAEGRENLLSFYDNLESIYTRPRPLDLQLLLVGAQQALDALERFVHSLSLLMASLSPSLPFYARGMESVADRLTRGVSLLADSPAAFVACPAEVPLPTAAVLPPSPPVAPPAVAEPSAASAKSVAPRLLEPDAERCWHTLVHYGYCRREADRYCWQGTTRQFGYMVAVVSERLNFYSPDGNRHLLWREFATLFALKADVNSAQTQLTKYNKGIRTPGAVQEMTKLQSIL